MGFENTQLGSCRVKAYVTSANMIDDLGTPKELICFIAGHVLTRPMDLTRVLSSILGVMELRLLLTL